MIGCNEFRDWKEIVDHRSTAGGESGVDTMEAIHKSCNERPSELQRETIGLSRRCNSNVVNSEINEASISAACANFGYPSGWIQVATWDKGEPTQAILAVVS